MRRLLDPLVKTGTVRCVRCNGMIDCDDAWHLDHNERGGWLGPAHAKCNLRAGWEKMTGRDAVNGDGEAADEPPRLWSQRWTSDPPVGTQVLLRGGMCEVYLGGGWWSHPVPFEREVE